MTLLRSFVGASLKRYFSENEVINWNKKPIRFFKLRGEREYRNILNELYTMKSGAWMTPSEIFGGLFSDTIARYILKNEQHHEKNRNGVTSSYPPLVIYEAGAGSGTHALNFLNYLKKHAHDVYRTCSYRILEVSPMLRNLQEERVCGPHGAVARVLETTDVCAEWSTSDIHQYDGPCWFIGLELLDNLPHDKVAWDRRSNQQILCEAVIEDSQEKLVPLSDPVIMELLKFCPQILNHHMPPEPEYSSTTELFLSSMKAIAGTSHRHRASFVPTGALQMLHQVRQSLPNARMILTDFAELPPPSVLAVDDVLVARNSPLVCGVDKATGCTIDFPSYVIPEGTADIFWPQDFDTIASLAKSVGLQSSFHHMPQGEWLKPYVDLKQATTRSGYCPILQNEDTGPEGVHDMVNMSKLHEPGILHNLRKRHRCALPYTYTGRIVIAVNPYRLLPELYEQRTQAMYVNTVDSAVRDSLAPHIYSVSAAAMSEVKKGKGQSILVSGESGAGKTETVKILISHLAFISSKVEEEMLQEEVAGNDQSVRIRKDATSIITKIVDLNPLLEAFGNAKTVRNDNSSRFGKFTRLQMVVDDSNSASRMIGSRSATYLLEKSRVIFHEPGERSFHIFYQLLAGAPAHVRDACLLGNRTAGDFSYLMPEMSNDERETSGLIDGKSDAERFDMTCKALDLAGLPASEQLELFRGIAGCLFLGLLSFNASGDDEESSIVSCKHSLEPVVNTLGLSSSKDLEAVLTIRQVKARGEIIFAPNRPSASANARDAMAKALYATLFTWLVSRINRSTAATLEDRVQRSQTHEYCGDILSYDGNADGSPTDINLLDIFGFESFKANFFEQLLINYANEKLQQRFTLDVFRTQQQEYEAEGVPWSHIDYSDNSEVLWLIESPSGVIGLLNEECVVPRGADSRLVFKLNSIHDEHVAFVAEKPGHASEERFGIRHYAATVVYTAIGMLEKNKDVVSESIIEILQRSNLGVIREAFSLSNLNEEGGGGGTGSSLSSSGRYRRTQASISNSGSRSLASTFKNSLASLMEAVNQTQVQYIRCIKPNETKSSSMLEPLKVISQLRCAGVIEAIRISRAAYTNRLAYDVFQSRFRMLAPGLLNKEDKYCSGSVLLEYLLTQREGDSTSVYELGRTKVFFRAGALESLERRRRDLLCLKAIRLQAFYRMHIAQVRFCRALEGVRLIQAFTRGWQARLRFYMIMRRILQIQCFFRMNRAIQVTQQLREFRAATKIEALCRGRPMRIRFMLWRQSAITIQAWVRGCLAVRHFAVAIHDHREAQKLENQVAALQARLAAEEEARLHLQSQLELSKAVESKPSPDVMNTQFQYSNSGLPNEEFDAMLHESGVIIVALKSEVMKLREQNETLKEENDDLKRDRQHLLCDTTKFNNAATTHSIKRLTKANSALMDELVVVKEHCKKLQRQNHDRAEEVITLKQIYDNEVILRKTQLTLIEDIAMTLSAAETPIDDYGKGELVHYVNALYRDCMMEVPHMHSPSGKYPGRGRGALNVDNLINSVTSNVMDSFNFFKRTMKDSE